MIEVAGLQVSQPLPAFNSCEEWGVRPHYDIQVRRDRSRSFEAVEGLSPVSVISIHLLVEFLLCDPQSSKARDDEIAHDGVYVVQLHIDLLRCPESRSHS